MKSFHQYINVCLILCTRGWLSDHDRISNDSVKRNYFFMLRQFMTSWNLEFYNLDLNIYIWISREQKEHLKWNKKTFVPSFKKTLKTKIYWTWPLNITKKGARKVKYLIYRLRRKQIKATKSLKIEISIFGSSFLGWILN